MDPIATAHYGMMAASHRYGDEQDLQAPCDTPDAEASPDDGGEQGETRGAFG